MEEKKSNHEEEGRGKGKKYRNVVFDLGGVLLAWDPKAFIAHMFSDRPAEAVPLELAHATSLPCWKLLDKGYITRDESVDLLPAPYSKGNYESIIYLVIYLLLFFFATIDIPQPSRGLP